MPVYLGKSIFVKNKNEQYLLEIHPYSTDVGSGFEPENSEAHIDQRMNALI
ncbi:MAG: hypothetical protein J6573_05280 [Lactobacillus sp.]|uniref:hypothetical protein n=1 Tax=Bombilactobacillus bombi TaxID=1303590 RepID=UPI0015F92AA6|nr:hypothetical protein [Bombilactobacillus bombi]MCO6541698.1 hypothetical protein [Lactobacillus sp.]